MRNLLARLKRLEETLGRRDCRCNSMVIIHEYHDSPTSDAEVRAEVLAQGGFCSAHHREGLVVRIQRFSHDSFGSSPHVGEFGALNRRVGG